MAAPIGLTDALADAGAALADAQMKEFLLSYKVLAKRGADHEDPKYYQYKAAYEEAAGAAQQAKNAMGQPRMDLVNWYLDNPAELDALFGIV